jgi:hypothetical protein
VCDSPVANVFLHMLLAFALLGGALAIFLGTLAALGLWQSGGTKALERRFTPEQWAQLQRRLEELPKATRSYTHWKMRLDPVYALVIAELPLEGELVDLGTGIGLLPMMLGLTRPLLHIRGVEWDRRKAKLAQNLLRGLPRASVEEADARAYSIGSASAITMLDILHYSPFAQAQRWLAMCAAALAPGGVLLIRDLEPSPWAIAVWMERIWVHSRWNRGGGVHPRPSSELAEELTGYGLTVVTRRAGFGLFRANTLTTARRPTFAAAK